MHRYLRSGLYFSLFLPVSVLLLLEIAMRVYFALQIGPRVIAYGTSAYRMEYGDRRRDRITQEYIRELGEWETSETQFNTVYRQGNKRGGYDKFFPHEEKYHKDADTGRHFKVQINSHGFRGKEFSVEKPENVIRVLTLGASATFGFFNREDETYPYQMERFLNARCQGTKTFEVINFAIPKAVADQILSLFIAEGIALNPDVITFYEGRNDSDRIHPLTFQGGRNGLEAGDKSRGIWHELSQRSIVARFVSDVIERHSRLSSTESLRLLNTVAGRTSREFLDDIKQIWQLANQRNILFVVSNQQANSKSWFGLPTAERQKLKGFTYQDEVRQIHSLLSRGENLSGYEFNFLVHDRLMRDLKQWAQQKQVPFVDIIKLLDSERHHMLSYVHLDAHANRRIAAALGEEILRRKCSAMK